MEAFWLWHANLFAYHLSACDAENCSEGSDEDEEEDDNDQLLTRLCYIP